MVNATAGRLGALVDGGGAIGVALVGVAKTPSSTVVAFSVDRSGSDEATSTSSGKSLIDPKLSIVRMGLSM